MVRMKSLLFGGFVLLLLLTGCYLVSGERTETVPLEEPDGAGELTVRFVSADGETENSLATGYPLTDMVVDVVVVAEEGELTLEIISARRTPPLAVSGRYGMAGQGVANVQTDGAGEIKYRITASEVRNGNYVIRYRIRVTPTPTPSTP